MFSSIRVISLARTPERLEAFRKHWPTDLDYPIHFHAHDGFAAPPPDSWFQIKKYRSTEKARLGAWGCLQSHIGVLRQAMEYGLHLTRYPLFVVEDDCLIDYPQRLKPFIDSMPSGWQLGYAGCQHEREPYPVSSAVLKVGGAGRTHALIIAPHFIPELLALWEGSDVHADWILRDNAYRFNFFAPTTNIASQMSNESTIVEGEQAKRTWNYTRKSPVIILDCPREVVNQLRKDELIHTGYHLNPETGIDYTLENLAFNHFGHGEERDSIGRMGFMNWLHGSSTECGVWTETNMLERAACAIWCPGGNLQPIYEMMPKVRHYAVTDYANARRAVEEVLAETSMSKPTERVFVHSGKLGDIVYALPAIREMGGGKLIIVPDPDMTGSDMPESLIDSLRPLAATLGYISSIERRESVSGPIVNLNAWRMGGKRGKNIAEFTLGRFGKDLRAADKPWLHVEPNRMAGVVVARSLISTARRDNFPWIEVNERYDDSVFVGSREEWEDWRCRFGQIRWLKTDNLLELSRVIAGADLMICNQSCPLAIAHALGRRVVVEVTLDNCRFTSRPDDLYDFDGSVKLPDISEFQARCQTADLE